MPRPTLPPRLRRGRLGRATPAPSRWRRRAGHRPGSRPRSRAPVTPSPHRNEAWRSPLLPVDRKKQGHTRQALRAPVRRRRTRARLRTAAIGRKRRGMGMGDFEEVHRDRIVGSLAMFDRLIFKGHLTAFYRPRAVRAFLWNQGVPLTRFAEYLR